jgi:hypothetical protein
MSQTATLADLSPIAILALSKLLTEKVINDARDQVEAGDHEVEVVLHFRGDLEVEEDSETMQVNRLQPMLLLKLALDKLNKVSVDSLVAEALEILKKRKTDEDGDEIEEEDVVAFKKSTAAAYKRLAKATKQRKRGAVKFEGEITPIEA